MLKGLQNIFKRSDAAAKSLPYPGGSPIISNPFGSVFGWMGWNKVAQLQLGYANKTVYAFANVKVRKLVESPILVYQVKSERERRKLARFSFKGAGNDFGQYNILQNKALQELDSHALITLLERPNPYQTGIEMMEAFWFNYTISGDGYLWAEKPAEGRNAGQPIRLFCLPSNLVQPVKNWDSYTSPIAYYVFTAWSGQQIIIQPEDMLHLAQWSPFDPAIGGYSPLIPGAKSVATNEANQEAQGRAFVNGSTGLIIASEPGVTSDGKKFDKLTAEQVGNIKETLRLQYQGAANNQGTHVTNGYVEVHKLGDTLADLQLVEAEKANWKDMGALFGVSPILVGDMSGGTESNVQAAYKALVTNVVVPELRKFDMKFKAFMSNWYQMTIIAQHDLTEFSELAPDYKLTKEVYGDADYISQNEKRKLFNFDEDEETPGMNSYLVPGSKKTLEQIVDGNFTEPDQQFDYRSNDAINR